MTLPPNQYQVTVQSTEASRRCKLAGEYLVSPDTDTLILLACKTGHIIYSWPYRLLRKFGQLEVKYSPTVRKDFGFLYKISNYTLCIIGGDYRGGSASKQAVAVSQEKECSSS